MLALLPLAAAAQDGKPIEWVIGYAAGGGSDIVARSVAEVMTKSLGQTLVISNKPGAATNIAAEYVAKTKDPAHVMLTADFATLAANPSLFAKLPYNPEKDFAPVGMLARFPMLLVVAPNVPAKNFKEFVAWAKTNATGTNYASAGIGSPHHLAGELLREQDLLGGQVPFGMMDSATVQQYIVAGKLRALGVASAKRLPTMADVPTLAEQGLAGFEAYAWQGLVVPSGASPETVARLNNALLEALNATPVKARFQTLALEAMPGTPAQMAAYAKSERERWGKLIRDNNIKLD
jgi:tripartite-type tricarboxylate transporter receptor subunit TctC